jgi:hypothetical protein
VVGAPVVSQEALAKGNRKAKTQMAYREEINPETTLGRPTLLNKLGVT